MTQNVSATHRNTPEPRASFTKAVTTDQNNIIEIIDKSLKHLNQISQANLVAQDLYIELLKEKKTMKFDQIKKIYFTLTEGKAKEVLFQKDKKQLIETDYQNHQGLIRLCWRSIQKLIKKITYYMINQNHLSVISKNVLKLIHLNQKFVRRFHKLKNSSMHLIVQFMQKLIEENSILEKKIYDILLNRGYVVSLDEFYQLNGYDAQHREAYYAKQQEVEISSSQEEEEQMDKQKGEIKSSSKNSKNQTIRKKKKGFRIDFRYSWRQKIEMEQKEEDQQKYPVNKTNFEIRQSFEQFIGDFLENDNLNEVLVNYEFEAEDLENKAKQNNRMSEVSIMQKKIFQNKIETVINQLKGNSFKVSSKLLKIINNSSDHVITSKVNYSQQKFLDRKNNESITQRKLLEAHSINDRKIINESFFRELLRRNAKIQNSVNKEIMKDANKIKHEMQNFAYRNPKANPNAISLNKKEHNQKNTGNNFKLWKKSKFSRDNMNQMLIFKPRTKIKDDTASFESIKSTLKFMEAELNSNYLADSKKNISDLKHGKSVAEKIRIAKEGWQLRNEKTILEAIQNLTIDPSNSMKITEMLQSMNRKKDNKAQSLIQKIKNEDEISKSKVFSNRKIMRLRTIQTELGPHLQVDNTKCQDMNQFQSQAEIKATKLKRVKTEISPRNFSRTQFFGGNSANQNLRPYEVYDCRLRRILRR